MRESELQAARYEPSDVGTRLAWIGIPAILLGVLALSWAVLKLYPGGTVDRTLQLPLPHYPAPELQTDPVNDMNQLRNVQRRRLGETGWADQQRQFAHVPIEDAMRQIATGGIADWPAVDQEALVAH